MQRALKSNKVNSSTQRVFALFTLDVEMALCVVKKMEFVVVVSDFHVLTFGVGVANGITLPAAWAGSPVLNLALVRDRKFCFDGFAGSFQDLTEFLSGVLVVREL